ncbi:MAG: Lrp/AsnC family transcriptional regulator [Armatimonadetes bacterium]|nr:Lrp/AsnC family transcriptional regulator [Armatimonadota bacterium]
MLEKVLRVLEEDCRTSPKEIATRLGIEEAEVQRLVAEAEQRGAIMGYGAIVNWAAVAPERVFAFILVSAQPERDIGFDDIANRIARFPEVHSVYLVSGTHDLTVVVEAKDFREVAAFVSEKLAPLPGVRSTATSFVLKIYKLEGRLIGDGGEADKRLAVSP